jgi:tetratricopeptide (TPR) repeat protein
MTIGKASLLCILVLAVGCTPSTAGDLQQDWAICIKSPVTEAIAACTRIIGTDPDKINVARAYHNRGLAYDNNDKIGSALKDYSKAIELDPSYSSPLNNRGIIYVNQRKLSRALQDFNRAIELDPKNFYALNSRGRFFLLQKNDPKRALADFEQALALEPRHSISHANAGFAQEKLGQKKEAIEHFESALALGTTATQTKIIKQSLAKLKK